jgi:thioredoxin 1
MQELNISEMEQEVLSGNVIVEFGAEWCGPCKALTPLLEEISTETRVIKVDIDKQDQEELAKYGIRSIPTIIAYKDGSPIKRLVGMQSKSTLTKMFE